MPKDRKPHPHELYPSAVEPEEWTDFDRQFAAYRERLTISELAMIRQSGGEWATYEVVDRLLGEDGGYFRKIGWWGKQVVPSAGLGLKDHGQNEERADRDRDSNDLNAARQQAAREQPDMFESPLPESDLTEATFKATDSALLKWNQEGGRAAKTYIYDAVRREVLDLIKAYTPERIMKLEDLQKFTGLEDPADASILETLDVDLESESENFRRYFSLCIHLDHQEISVALAARVVGVSDTTIYKYRRKLRDMQAGGLALFRTTDRGAEEEPGIGPRNPDIVTKEYPEGIMDITPYLALTGQEPRPQGAQPSVYRYTLPKPSEDRVKQEPCYVMNLATGERRIILPKGTDPGQDNPPLWWEDEGSTL